MIEKNVLVFGMPVKLKHRLGIFNQIKLKDVLSKNIDVNELSKPFLLDRELSKMFNDGKLFNVFFLDKMVGNGKSEMMDKLVKSLSIIYDTDEIYIDYDFTSVIIKGEYILDKDNYDYLCNSICRALMIDKNAIQRDYDKNRDKDKNETETDRKFREMRERSLRNRNKSKDDEMIGLIDIANYLIHSSDKYTYETVQDLTIWQIKNSFNLLKAKENYEIEMAYRTSGQFSMDNKINHWFFKNQ